MRNRLYPTALVGPRDARRDSALGRVAFHFRFQQLNGGSAIVDDGPNRVSVTVNGSAALSTAQARIGQSSLSIPGTSGHSLDLPNVAAYKAPGVPWFIEYSIYVSSFAATKVILDTNTIGTNNTGFAVYFGTDGLQRVYSGGNYGGAGSAATLNAWNDFAVLWDGGTLAFFSRLAGQAAFRLDATAGSFGNVWSGANGPRLFADSMSNAQGINGYAGYIRLTKGFSAADYSAVRSHVPFVNRVPFPVV